MSTTDSGQAVTRQHRQRETLLVKGPERQRRDTLSYGLLHTALEKAFWKSANAYLTTLCGSRSDLETTLHLRKCVHYESLVRFIDNEPDIEATSHPNPEASILSGRKPIARSSMTVWFFEKATSILCIRFEISSPVPSPPNTFLIHLYEPVAE